VDQLQLSLEKIAMLTNLYNKAEPNKLYPILTLNGGNVNLTKKKDLLHS
jgi:hypothetical protein